MNPGIDNQFIPNLTPRPLATNCSLISGGIEDVADYCDNSRCIEQLASTRHIVYIILLIIDIFLITG